MEHKIELQINNNDSTIDIYIENVKTKEYTIVDTWLVAEDDLQIEKLKESYEYLGYEVTIKKYTPED